MNKLAVRLSLVGLFLFAFFPVCAYSEQAANKEEIVLTTYYPAPYGDFQNLRLWPSKQKPCTEDKRGILYYDETANKVMVCTLLSDNLTYAWQDLGVWEKKEGTDIIYPNDTAVNVGIGGKEVQDYGKGTSKLDTHGYAAANDVWLKDAKRWASQQVGLIGGFCTQGHFGPVLEDPGMGTWPQCADPIGNAYCTGVDPAQGGMGSWCACKEGYSFITIPGGKYVGPLGTPNYPYQEGFFACIAK